MNPWLALAIGIAIGIMMNIIDAIHDDKLRRMEKKDQDDG